MKPVCALCACLLAGIARAEDYSFDAGEFESKTFEFGGYTELKQEAFVLRPDSVPARLNFPDGRERLDRTTATVELAGAWHLQDALIDLRSHSDWARDQRTTGAVHRIREGGLHWAPSHEFGLDLGKRVQRWGKGYAWNPVGFVERAKDANDPQQTREGYLMAGTEWVKSLDGPLATVAVTALALPTRDNLNSDFGHPGHTNPAAKIYMLWHDTDIDLLWLGKGSRPARFGLDFSRNLGANLEAHGEWARIYDQPRQVADATGNVTSSTGDADNWLLGLRYLTEREVTWIAEYYRNGGGYTADELADFYAFADAALTVGGAAVDKAATLAMGGYGRPNTGRDYLYLRASAKEPFDWLYVTPALTAIANLGDHSYTLTPELSYTGITNLELRARAAFTRGGRYSEFGEKPVKRSFEVYARWYF